MTIITTSERRAFKRCPQRWWWEYREGLAPKYVNSKLWFGIGIHESLAHLLGPGKKRRKDFIDKWHAFCDEDELSIAIKTRGDTADLWVEARALGEAMLRGYVEHYNWDRAWDVIYTEEPFAIEIPDPDDAKSVVRVFNSTFDGVIRDEGGRCWLIEHKTAASISVGHLPMDDQAGAYWAVATLVLRHKGILGPHERIVGIIYNFLRKALPDPRERDAEGYCLNKNGSRSKNQPAALFERYPVRRTANERARQIRNIANEAVVMDWHRESNGRYLYKFQTRDCSWDCPFRDPCELHEQNADWREYMEAMFVVQDPYSRYRGRKTAASDYI